MKGIFKKALLTFIPILLVAGTLFIDSRLDASLSDTQDQIIEVIEKGDDAVFKMEHENSYQVDSGSKKRMTVLLSGNALLRFAPGSSALLTISERENSSINLHIKILKGRFWLNNLNSIVSVEITTPFVMTIAKPGVFDMHYGESTLILLALRHSMRISIFGNFLVLPEGRQIVISEEKLARAKDTIAKLRYSKLSKEIPYTDAEKPDEWISLNQKDDAVFFENYKKKVIEDVRSAGRTFTGDSESFMFQVGQTLKRMHRFLTIDPAKKAKQDRETMVGYFDAGLNALIIGKSKEAEELFGEAASSARDFSQDTAQQREIVRKFSTFAFAGPLDQFFKAKITLRTLLGESHIANLQMAFSDVLDMAASGSDIETKNKVAGMLRQFGLLAERSLNAPARSEDAPELFSESILISDFLMRRPELLHEEFLKIAELFERSHLALLETTEQAEEERQFFIAEKLKLISILKIRMEAGDMPFQDARNAILLLATQIESLKPTFSDTAVASYFEEQLTSLSPLIAFLRGSSAQQVRGSFKENFEDFSSRVEEMKKVTELLATATGGTQISPFRREELAGIVAEDLGGIGIEKIKITLPEQEDDLRVRITNAEFEEGEFTALYDTGRKVMSDVILKGETIPNAIRLENVKNFFLIKLDKLVLPTGVTPESLTEAPSKESLLEKVTKETLLFQLEQVAIAVEEKYLGFENLKEGVVHVRLASIGEGADAKVFSFDIMQKTSAVENLKVQTVLGEVPVNDTFALRELPIKVEQIYQRALFEKQKEEELKKFLNEVGTSTEISN